MLCIFFAKTVSLLFEWPTYKYEYVNYLSCHNMLQYSCFLKGQWSIRQMIQTTGLGLLSIIGVARSSLWHFAPTMQLTFFIHIKHCSFWKLSELTISHTIITNMAHKDQGARAPPPPVFLKVIVKFLCLTICALSDF